MNQAIVNGVSPTVPHELGHAFGLLQYFIPNSLNLFFSTFTGISEVRACSECYENTASDLKGDFCQDTTPTPINWMCKAQIAATGQYKDQCNPNRSIWENPYLNAMSYGSCGTVFTECQLKRIRCSKINH